MNNRIYDAADEDNLDLNWLPGLETIVCRDNVQRFNELIGIQNDDVHNVYLLSLTIPVMLNNYLSRNKEDGLNLILKDIDVKFINEINIGDKFYVLIRPGRSRQGSIKGIMYQITGYDFIGYNQDGETLINGHISGGGVKDDKLS